MYKVYSEFPEFSRKQIKVIAEMFKKFDEDGDNFIDFMELKRMMEKLGEAQTHLVIKALIEQVDEDKDGKISQREFFAMFRLAINGELVAASEFFKKMAETIDVPEAGVKGAADFFQKKINEHSAGSPYEKEIKEEQEEKNQMKEEQRRRREKFLETKANFQ